MSNVGQLTEEEKRMADEAVAESTPVLQPQVQDTEWKEAGYVRGKITNPEYQKQIFDFTQLRFGNMTPTDLDGFIDYHGTHFIFLEYKYLDGSMRHGQQLALERLADASERGGVKCLLIVASHENSSGEIDGSRAIVKQYRYKGSWHYPNDDSLHVLKLVTKFIQS